MKAFTSLIIIALLCFGSASCNTQKKIAKKKGKLETIIQREAIYYDVDFKSITSGNLSKQYKDNIKERVMKITPDDIKKDISEFINAYEGPELEDAPQYLIDEIYSSVKRERQVAWADAMYAFGEGLQGNTANQNAMASNKIRNKRELLYLKLKEIDNRNKITQATWQKYFIDDLLKFVALKTVTQKDGWIKLKDEVEYISM